MSRYNIFPSRSTAGTYNSRPESMERSPHVAHVVYIRTAQNRTSIRRAAIVVKFQGTFGSEINREKYELPGAGLLAECEVERTDTSSTLSNRGMLPIIATARAKGRQRSHARSQERQPRNLIRDRRQAR